MSIFAFASNPALAAETFACASSSPETTLIVVGKQEPEAYAQLGFSRIIHLTGSDPLPENYARSIAQTLKEHEARAFVVSADATGRDVAARVAGYLDVPMISDATTVQFDEQGISTSRLTYGGAVVESTQTKGCCVIGIAPGSWSPLPTAGVSSELVAVEGAPDNRVTLVSEQPIEKSGVDLTKAERVVCAGMGFSTAEELQTAHDLAAALGAEVGCTRGLAEDHGWFSEYIGLSGLQISPRLYLSLGVSGQVQHSVGTRGSRIIVAVGKDAAAPIFSNCDYGIVGDMFDVSRSIIKALQA